MVVPWCSVGPGSAVGPCCLLSSVPTRSSCDVGLLGIRVQVKVKGFHLLKDLGPRAQGLVFRL